jgi:hypothetical protein
VVLWVVVGKSLTTAAAMVSSSRLRWLLAGLLAALPASPVTAAPAQLEQLSQLGKRAPRDCSQYRGDTPKPPSCDSWYRAPSGYESKAPGAVLKVRPAPGNLTAAAGGLASSSWNVLYRTTNSRGKPTFAVTTVFTPKTLPPTGPALLSYQHFMDSADVDSSPSFDMQEHGVYDDVQMGLAHGWAVSVPDYEGPDASFSAGTLSGQATLDGVRAVLNAAGSVGLAKGAARYALYGYSGGGLATEWASELARKYAPELKFAGIAMGGITPNITKVLFNINQAESAGLAPVSSMVLKGHGRIKIH